MNVADYVVLGIVFMCVVLAVVCMIINRRKRNKGQHTGCGDCTQCTECNRNADGN
ncbi:MAG TPA: FeoB-associated Cys-rich membrane protein [Lachnospiraceae bacterium]|nr:FeoB-associated Cys-rich membrane protein [Lachnospiraceae bacterium]